jgi:hypothetical protein
MEPRVSLSCSQQPATGPQAESVHTSTLQLFKIRFNIVESIPSNQAAKTYASDQAAIGIGTIYSAVASSLFPFHIPWLILP